MKKQLLSIFILLTALTCHGQGQKNNQPASLPAVAGWEKESFKLPPDFAPKLPLQGNEDILFAPGWGDKNSLNHWSYCFLWSVTKNPDYTADNLKAYLTDYFTGLVRGNLKDKNTPLESPINISLGNAKPAGAEKEYEGIVEMPDYVSHLPLKLNVRIFVSKSGNAFLAFSKQPFTAEIWQQLNDIHSQLTGF